MTTTLSSSLTRLLKDVSRSFYLTVRVLPAGVRPQIGLAYLFARTSDTIADTELVPLAQRLEVLRSFQHRVFGQEAADLKLGEIISHQELPAERQLLERHSELFSSFQNFDSYDRQLVREVLAVIMSGQELDLVRFAKSSAQNIIALNTETELDDYTYRVAGCVGEFWTKICRRHLFPQAAFDDEILLRNSREFGQGLQLVNILRDLAADLRLGRCYLPLDRLQSANLQPSDLLQTNESPAFRALFNAYLDKAAGLLASGWDYTNSLPRACLRVRLACAWPILIGVKTLAQLRANPVLDPAKRIKISRAQVRQVILHTVMFYPWPRAWQGLFTRPILV